LRRNARFSFIFESPWATKHHCFSTEHDACRAPEARAPWSRETEAADAIDAIDAIEPIEPIELIELIETVRWRWRYPSGRRRRYSCGMLGEENRGAPTREELEAVVAASRIGWLLLDPLDASMRATALLDLLDVPDGAVDVGTVISLLDPTDAARVLEGLSIAVHSDETQAIAVHTRPRNGRRRTLKVAFRRVERPRPGAVAVFRDASDDESITEELRLLGVAHDGLERLAPGGTWVFDMATMTLKWSEGVFRLHGLDPATFTPSVDGGFELVHPEDRHIIVQMSTRATIEGESGPFDSRIIHPGGAERIISTHVHLERDAGGGPVRMIGAVVDVTEQRQREKMLADAQRTDALGRMAGGIAHDFNNLLAAMTLGLEVARRRRSSQEAVTAGLDSIEAAVSRASALARQLLAFSRRQPLSPRVLQPERVLGEMEGLLRRLIGGRVALAIVREGDETWPVKVDQTQFEQIVLNLVLNARDAISDTGTIRIELRNIPADAVAASGPHVGMDVVDDGVGMSPELQARIFDPFFTTKRPGEGTGLGLATCVAIVQQARGRIAVSSTPGAGSRFSVQLPRSLEPLPIEGRSTPPALARQLKVLVVDDDDAVRGGIVHELEWQGHAAMGARSAAEAIQLAAGFPAPIDLILTDVLLGRDDGVTLARELAARLPGARVLLITGFVPGTGDATMPFPVLAKPFTSEALAMSIAKVMARGSDSAPAG
jgi:signal transduction histidine kinase